MKLKVIIEEIESYTRMLKSKRRDKKYILKEIQFLTQQGIRILEEKEYEKS